MREIIAAYLAAVMDTPEQFVGEAAQRFNAGLVERTNKAFAPTPPQLAEESRRLWHAALKVQEDTRNRQLALSRPAEKLTQEEQARRKAFVDKTLERIGKKLSVS